MILAMVAFVALLCAVAFFLGRDVAEFKHGMRKLPLARRAEVAVCKASVFFELFHCKITTDHLKLWHIRQCAKAWLWHKAFRMRCAVRSSR